jgi:uncharacterized protein YvpB
MAINMKFIFKMLFSLFLAIHFFIPNFAEAQSCNNTITCRCEFPTPVTATDSQLNLASIDESQRAGACATFCSGQTSYIDQARAEASRVTGSTSVAPPTYPWKLLCGNVQIATGNIDIQQAATDEVVVYQAPRLSIPILNFQEFSPAVREGGSVRVNYIGQYVNALFNYLLIIASLISVVAIMVAGLQMMTARGDSGKVSNAKSGISKALFSLFILLFSFTILRFFDPSLTSTDGIKIQFIEAVPFTENTSVDIASLNLPDPAGGTNGVPYFSQRDFTQKYGDCTLADGTPTTIKTSGCGPTSFAMVLKYFGANVDPVVVADKLVAEGHRICGRGTNSYGFFSSSLIKDNNLKGKLLTSFNSAVFEAELRSGSLIIVSVGKSRFTNSGHFIVITGMQSDGNFSINDPNSGIKTLTRQEADTIVKSGVSINRK